MATPSAHAVRERDPHVFSAVLDRRVIRSGWRASTGRLEHKPDQVTNPTREGS